MADALQYAPENRRMCCEVRVNLWRKGNQDLKQKRTRKVEHVQNVGSSLVDRLLKLRAYLAHVFGSVLGKLQRLTQQAWDESGWSLRLR
ncbi:unnamed protein product, partial [Cladocopium goreaui]